MSNNLQCRKIIAQSGDFGRQGFGQEAGIDLFGYIGAAVSEQTTDHRHRQTFIQRKDGEGMSRRVHRQIERQSYMFSDYSQ